MWKLRYSRLTGKAFLFIGAIFVLCFSIQNSLGVNIPSDLKKDTSSKIEIRTFSEGQLEKYRGSPDFQYIRNRPEALTWWSRAKQWMLQKMSDLIQYSTETNLGKTILILLVISLIIYLVYRMIGADETGLWMKKGKEMVIPDFAEENIQVVDFDQLIKDAAQKNDYRLAIRLWYLKTLKNLAGRDYIKWKPGKTNYEYADELQQTPFEVPFKKLTCHFEYGWYGEASVTFGEYEVLKEHFMYFNQQLRVK